MIELLWASALASAGPAGATMATAAVIQSEPAAGVIAQAEVIELELERNRRMTVPVTIAGAGPYRFIIDTGSQSTSLSYDLATRLQLTRTAPVTLVAMNSTRAVQTAHVPGLNFARNPINVAAAPLFDAADIGQAQGILGLDSLQDRRVLFDFINKEIAVTEAAQAPERNGYEIIVRADQRLGQLIITEAEIDSVRTAVIIDTGTEGSIGNTALFERLHRAQKTKDREITDVNGVEQMGATKIARTLMIDKVLFSDIAVTQADSPIFETLGLTDVPVLLLGMSELTLFERVAIDFGTREILFDVPSDARRVLPPAAPSGASRIDRN